MTVKELVKTLPEARFDFYRQVKHKDGSVEEVFMAYMSQKSHIDEYFGSFKVIAYGITEYDDFYNNLYRIYIKRR